MVKKIKINFLERGEWSASAIYNKLDVVWIKVDKVREVYYSLEKNNTDHPVGSSKWRKSEILSGGAEATEGVISTTWAELKALRDGGDLVAGTLYRITDYQCTTSQALTRSACNQFDIVLQALSNDTLAEEGWAMKREGAEDCEVWTMYFNSQTPYNVYVYRLFDESFNVIMADTLRGNNSRNLQFEQIDYEHKILYSNDQPSVFWMPCLPPFQFHDTNFAAWRVWYCLDNDTNRFDWALNLLSPDSRNKMIRVYYADVDEYYIYVRQPQLDNDNGLAWAYSTNGDGYELEGFVASGNEEGLETNDLIFTQTESPLIGSTLDMGGVPVRLKEISVGTGVIYRLIDEYDNDCPYDFKNIQFRVETDSSWQPLIDLHGHSSYEYVYTFNHGSGSLASDASIVGNVLHNEDDVVGFVGKNKINALVGYWTYAQRLNGIAILTTGGDYGYYGVRNNTFESCCEDIILGNSSNRNYFGLECQNIILKNAQQNKFSMGCERIVINYLANSYFGGRCTSIYARNGISNALRFGYNCNIINLPNGGNLIIIGNGCSNIDFEQQGCSSIMIGNRCSYISFKKAFTEGVEIGDDVYYINVTSSYTTSGSYMLNKIKIHSGVYGTYSGRKTISIAPQNISTTMVYREVKSSTTTTTSV